MTATSGPGIRQTRPARAGGIVPEPMTGSVLRRRIRVPDRTAGDVYCRASATDEHDFSTAGDAGAVGTSLNSRERQDHCVCPEFSRLLHHLAFECIHISKQVFVRRANQGHCPEGAFRHIQQYLDRAHRPCWSGGLRLQDRRARAPRHQGTRRSNTNPREVRCIYASCWRGFRWSMHLAAPWRSWFPQGRDW